MRRKRVYEKRVPLSDEKFDSIYLAKFTNFVMWNGEKQKAKTIVYSFMEKLQEQTQGSACDYFIQEVVTKAMSTVELRSVKIGGATYRVPIVSPEDRARYRAMRLIIKTARKLARSAGITMVDALVKETRNILNHTGESIKTKDEIEKTASANRAFAHFWGRRRRR